MGKLWRALLFIFGIAFVLLVGALLGAVFADQGLLGLLGIDREPTITAVTVLDRIQAMAELTTTRYNYSTIITSERDMPPLLAALYGERQMLVAVGYVDAGVDLRDIGVEDILISEEALTITLPAPALQACVLDEQSTYVAERDTGIFAPEALNLDAEARRFAIAEFRDQALESGILQAAQDEARAVVTQLLLASNPSVQQVTVAFAPPAPGGTLPESCG